MTYLRNTYWFPILVLIMFVFTGCQENPAALEAEKDAGAMTFEDMSISVTTDGVTLTAEQRILRKKLKLTARILAKSAKNQALAKAVKRGIELRAGNRYDENILFAQLLDNEDAEALSPSFAIKASDFGHNFRNKLDQASKRNLEAFLKADNITIYWPYSEYWDGSSAPTVTFTPIGEAAARETNVGFRLIDGPGKDTRIEKVTVSDEYAKKHPVWIVSPSNMLEGPVAAAKDYRGYIPVLQHRGSSSDNILMGNLIPPAPCPPEDPGCHDGGGGGGGGGGTGDDDVDDGDDGIAQIIAGYIKNTEHYDTFWNGGSDLRIIRLGGDIVNSEISIDPVIIDASTSRTQEDNGTWVDLNNTIWDSNWDEDHLNNMLAIYDEDTFRNYTLSATISVKLNDSVTISGEVEIEIDNDAPIHSNMYDRDGFMYYLENPANGTYMGQPNFGAGESIEFTLYKN